MLFASTGFFFSFLTLGERSNWFPSSDDKHLDWWVTLQNCPRMTNFQFQLQPPRQIGACRLRSPGPCKVDGERSVMRVTSTPSIGVDLFASGGRSMDNERQARDVMPFFFVSV